MKIAAVRTAAVTVPIDNPTKIANCADLSAEIEASLPLELAERLIRTRQR